MSGSKKTNRTFQLPWLFFLLTQSTEASEPKHLSSWPLVVSVSVQNASTMDESFAGCCCYHHCRRLCTHLSHCCLRIHQIAYLRYLREIHWPLAKCFGPDEHKNGYIFPHRRHYASLEHRLLAAFTNLNADSVSISPDLSSPWTFKNFWWNVFSPAWTAPNRYTVLSRAPSALHVTAYL